MKKSLSTDLTPENIETVLALLKETQGKLASLAEKLAPEQLTIPLGPGERLITEVPAHLLNSEALTADSITLALLKKEPLLHKLHPERDTGKLLHYELFPFAELLAYFSFRRKVLLSLLQSLNGKQWARTVREEGKQHQETVYWHARGQAMHELDLLDEIKAKINVFD